MAPRFFFNKNCNISPIIFHSPVKQKKKNHFPREKRFFFKFRTLHISKINSFLDLKRNTIIRQKLRTALHKNRSFPLRISSVNLTKFAEDCGFGHIY